MQKKYFHNQINNSAIAFILIVSTLSMPLTFLPKKAEAQSIAGYTSGIIPAITTLPQCKEVINSGIKSLFSGIGNLFSSSDNPNSTSNPSFEETFKADSAFKDKFASQFSKSTIENKAKVLAKNFDSIQVNITDTEEGQAILKTYQNSEAAKVALESINKNSTCIQSIGRLIIKMLLQKLTISTVNWINSGFDGSPAFIQDPGKFFGDIAKNEILQFGVEINNPELFPFGKAWMQNTALAFNNKFQDNARYSLDKLIQETTPEYSAATFQADFSQGGWNAWTAMTQAPANNPLGFKLMADNEIQRRLAGTSQSVAQNTRDALQAANGFLGDQRCVNPKGLTREEHERALDAGRTIVENGKTIIVGACQKWEYVTPGKLVSEAATTALNYQNNAYLNVTDLNDAVAAILDALLGQFSSSIMEKGFANIGDQGADGTLVYDTNSNRNPYRSQTEKDFIPSQLSSSWLSANPDFNIRTDLTQALIDEQRTYSDKLALQNKELMSTTDGKTYKLNTATGFSNAYGLIPVIYQLDYCIPGPHPGWEEDSRRTLAAALEPVLPETQSSLEGLEGAQVVSIIKSFMPAIGAAIGASLVVGTGAAAAIFGGTIIGSAVPILGTVIGAIIGLIGSFLVGLFGGGDEALNVRSYYASIIFTFTGVLPNYELEDDRLVLNIMSKTGMVGVLNIILDRYVTIMNKTYFATPEYLPTVTKEAATAFNQLTGYGQMMKNNEEEIALLKTTVGILGEIKNEVDDLNLKLETNQLDEIQYEENLTAQINAFGRLSASMVNGDDIASADNLYKQIIDKKDYIYKNLLKGPYGCEADLMKTPIPFPDSGNLDRENVAGRNYNQFTVNYVKRMTYPFPIIYDYNSLAAGTDIPDPWKYNPANDPTKINKMPTIGIDSQVGPGFLSFVFFGTHVDVFGNPAHRLRINDIIPTGGEVQEFRYRALGLRADSNCTSTNGGVLRDQCKTGQFETIIGIY